MIKCCIILLLLLAQLGCSQAEPQSVELHPTLGTELMIVPKGNTVGEYESPDHGVFMTERVLRGMIAEIIASCGKNRYW